MRLKLLPTLVTTVALLSPVLPARADNFQPWINQSVLATDHRAYCSDLVGQQVQNDIGTQGQNDIGSLRTSSGQSQQQDESHSSNMGGGINILGVGGKVQSSNSSSSRVAGSSNNQFGQSWNNSSQGSWDRSTVTSTTVGQNCDAFVQAGALVEAAHMNAETQRMGIQTQERMSIFGNIMGWTRQP